MIYLKLHHKMVKYYKVRLHLDITFQDLGNLKGKDLANLSNHTCYHPTVSGTYSSLYWHC